MDSGRRGVLRLPESPPWRGDGENPLSASGRRTHTTVTGPGPDTCRDPGDNPHEGLFPSGKPRSCGRRQSELPWGYKDVIPQQRDSPKNDPATRHGWRSKTLMTNGPQGVGKGSPSPRGDKIHPNVRRAPLVPAAAPAAAAATLGPGRGSCDETRLAHRRLVHLGWVGVWVTTWRPLLVPRGEHSGATGVEDGLGAAARGTFPAALWWKPTHPTSHPSRS